jgi:hypothetical protein
VCLGRFLGSIRGIFRPVTPVSSGIDVPMGREVLVPLASIVASLVTANNIYKRMFI